MLEIKFDDEDELEIAHAGEDVMHDYFLSMFLMKFFQMIIYLTNAMMRIIWI